MDSLLANYASSDGEENDEQRPPLQLKSPAKSVKSESQKEFFSKSTAKSGGFLSSLPPPKSKSLTNPKTKFEQIIEASKPESSSSSLFSILPQPSKKVVQFRPPTIPNSYSQSVKDEEDEEDKGEKEKERKKLKETVSNSSSVTSFLSSMPTPRISSTLGASNSASGTGRKSMLETGNQVSTDAIVNSNVEESKDQSSEKNYDYSSYTSNVSTTVGGSELNYDYSGMSSENGSYADYGGYGSGHCVDDAYGNVNNVENSNCGGSYGDYSSYAHYDNNWVDPSNVTPLPEASVVVENVVQFPGKRGRRDAPQNINIIEVKQDELMKNRPREDQVKKTGIAFGPSYEPTSTKGKPSKLHKRKHQIGSLFFDMKQKEMEYAERRANGNLTKAQTQAKYGW